MAGIQLRASPDPASYRTACSPAADALFVESDSTSPRGKLTQQITPIGDLENLVNNATDPIHLNFKVPRSRLLGSNPLMRTVSDCVVLYSYYCAERFIIRLGCTSFILSCVECRFSKTSFTTGRAENALGHPA